jgi:uncharacterized protein YbjT (DUF2867 family)
MFVADEVTCGPFPRREIMTEKTVLITSATGRQGGATLRHLAGQGGFRVRAMTRKPEGDAAKALRALGAEVVAGDFDDPASLERALAGVWGVFSVQNTWEAGIEKEEAQGKRLAELARDRGVQRFVYSSVGSAHKHTGIPHFENKFRVEGAIRDLGFPSYAIIRPVFFMENLLSPWFLQGDKLVTTIDPQTKLQMIAVDDIGRFGAKAFIDADRLNGLELDIAGDSVTMPQAAEAVTARLGKPVSYQPIALETVRQNSADMAKMLEWFDRVGYSADIRSLEPRFGIRPRTLQEWVHRPA